MGKPYALELRYVLQEALDTAESAEKELNSLYMLLALYMLDNSGGLLLTERGYSDEALLPFIDPNAAEDDDVAEEVMSLAEETSDKYRTPEVNCLHLVIAICRHRNSLAYKLLERAKVNPPELRNQAVNLLVNPLPKRYQALFEKHERQRPGRSSSTSTPIAQSGNQAAEHTEPLRPQGASRPVATAELQKSRTHGGQRSGGILAEVTIDLLARAEAGLIEAACGREHELDEIVDVLNKRKANNPLLIGQPGVGKTALVEGLAWIMAKAPERAPGLAGRRLYQLDTAKMFKGAELRGAFSQRLDDLKREVAAANGAAILFIDEIHALVQGSVDGSQEIAQELKGALARGEFPCIAATTTDEYKKTIQRDPALARRFHVIELCEPDERATLTILTRLAESYAEHHGVRFEPTALQLTVKLTGRYMRERCQPDKSLTVLDLAGSRARREGAEVVTERLVAEVVADSTGVPIEQLVLNEASRYLNLEERLAKQIIGHKAVLTRVASALRRNAAGFGGERPLGSFLFVGPTGVGKTEIARALAQELFGTRDALIRLDMSEYSEAHAVAKLIGAPPGYVGYAEGGVLTESIRRRPFQIVLFDEIEKAHADVHQLLLQLLDDGRLTDSTGKRSDFTNAVVIMTSNLGSDVFTRRGTNLGFSDGNEGKEKRLRSDVLAAVRERFSPELYNRIDEKIVFEPLSPDDVREVARLLLARTAKRLFDDKGIALVFDPALPDALMALGGYDTRFGARPMRRAIQTHVEGPLASLILAGELRSGHRLKVAPGAAGDDALSFSRCDEAR